MSSAPHSEVTASAINLGNIVTSGNRGRRTQAEQVAFRIHTNYRRNNLVYSGVKRLYNDTYVALLIESIDQFGVSKKGYENEGIGSLSSDPANGISDLRACGIANIAKANQSD